MARPYTYPTVDLLEHDAPINEAQVDAKARQTAAKLQEVIDSFGVSAKVCKFKNGAQKTRFLVSLAAGTKVNKATCLKDNFTLATGQPCAMGMEKGMVYIDVPNDHRRMIRIGDFNGSWDGCGQFSFALGDNTVCDIAKMPHLLIAGTTGSGKSVCINAILTSILYRNHPDYMKMVLIDPKQVELTPYNGLPHLAFPVITEVSDAVEKLEWACREMDRRYEKFSALGVKEFSEYNKKSETVMQRVLIVIDELADLMITSKKTVEKYIVRLAQKARAAGIHLVVATQRPTREVITGLIKANMPARIAFKCLSGIDSRVILDQTGAENLLGKGDMLYRAGDATEAVRLQGVFVSGEEVGRVCDFIRKQGLKSKTQTDFRKSEAYKKWGIFAKFMQG